MSHMQDVVKGFTKRIKSTFDWGIVAFPRSWFNIVILGREEFTPVTTGRRVLTGIFTPFYLSGSLIKSFLGFVGIIIQTLAFPFECLIAKIRDACFSPPPPAGNSSLSSSANKADPDSSVTEMTELLGNTGTLTTLNQFAPLHDSEQQKHHQAMQAVSANIPPPEEVRTIFMDLASKYSLPPNGSDCSPTSAAHPK